MEFKGNPAFLAGSGPAHALGFGLHVVEAPPGLSVAEAVRRYKADPNVARVEPDSRVQATATVNDSLWSSQWNMLKIAAPAAWDTQTSASDVIVAIIDTGIDFTHPDLQANLWTNPADGSHGFRCIDGVCAAGGQDDYGHGTHVAGVIGAVANNGAGVAGINWRTQLLACKFLDSSGSGSASDAILCFNQILSLKQQGFNIRVTNNSWGGPIYSDFLKQAMQTVEAAGVLNVCAAGNSGANADLYPMFPGAYDNRGILSVLATDSDDAAAGFTNFGVAAVDIAAPGVGILSTVPMGTCSLCDPTGYRPASGTSMATPHVAGVAAALFHRNPALSAAQARDVLLDPGSYDAMSSAAAMTSSGGRLNFAKALANPLLMAPKLNNFPTISAVSSPFVNAGDAVSLTATSSDPDNDPLRMVWLQTGLGSAGLFGFMTSKLFPSPSGNSVAFQAPTVARTAVAAYSAAVADGRGGSAAANSFVTVQPSGAGAPPYGALSVSPTSGPAGTTVTVNFPVTDPQSLPVAWEVWQTTTSSGNSRCCLSTASTTYQLDTAGVYRFTVQAANGQLNFSNRQTAVVRIGGATGTPPIANATFDKLSGAAPLSVNVDMTGSVDPDGSITTYLVNCQFGVNGYGLAGPKATCTYDTPGTYMILLQVLDNQSLLDVVPAYVVVTPTPTSGGTPKLAATVSLGNLSQTYTGAPLTPTATTNPPGLPVIWSNAPQTNAGTYAVTATINDPNYQGTASGTFVIAKAAATVTLGSLSQTYTGAPLTPTATTNPAGRSVSWTNAPQTKAGSYAVTATINDPNYQGSAGGTFVIAKASASLALSNLVQSYTGAPLAPTAATNPPGLAVAWTNAPQTNVGAYAITATITDPNYSGSSSGTFTIQTQGTPPTASIVSPGSGSSVSAKSTVTIQGAISAGTYPIGRVDFLVDGAVTCSDTAAPYTCAWRVPAATGKSYQLQIVAYDTTGRSGSSSPVRVTSSR